MLKNALEVLIWVFEIDNQIAWAFFCVNYYYITKTDMSQNQISKRCNIYQPVLGPESISVVETP